MKADKKNLLIKLIDEIPESEILSLKNKNQDHEFEALMYASESSIGFWNNDIDDEVWNNVYIPCIRMQE